MKLLEQIEIFQKLGYRLNAPVTKLNFINILQKGYSELSKNEIERLFDKPDGLTISKTNFNTVYYYLGSWNESEKNYITDNCLWWEFDMFGGDGKIEYVEFMKRMGVISRGELKFTDINCFFEEGEICTRYITFTVNGIAKRWNLGNADYIPDSYILRFALLCEELNTKGKYTIYDDGGILFVLDYATEEEQNKFNEVTKLGRIWLKDGNHFSKPID